MRQPTTTDMVATALAAPIVMGAVLVLFTAWLSRRAHRRSAPERPAADGDPSMAIGQTLQSPRAWGAIFVALVALGVAGAAQVSAGGLSSMLVPLVALLVVGYVIVGSYAAVRARGGGAASAVAAAGWIAGLLAVVAITAQLLLG